MIEHDDEAMDPHAAYRDEEHGSLRGRLESLLPNVLRKTVSTGVGARQMTEEVVRNALGDMKLPKEAVTYLVDLADNTKKEVVRVAAREFREFLESARFNDELARILTTLSFEIRTEIRFVPNDDRLRPRVNSSAQIKTGNRAADEDEIAAADGINEAIRTGAQDIAELMLARVFKARDEGGTAASTEKPDAPKAASETSTDEPQTTTAEKPPRASSAAKKKAPPRKRTTATKKSEPDA